MTIDLQVVIPTRKRVEMIRHPLALFPDALICCAEEEVDSYRAAYPTARFLPHPNDNERRGLGYRRQWILDHVDSEVVFQVDDDVRRLVGLVGQNRKTFRSPEDARAVVVNTARVAKEIGTSCFGYQHNGDIRNFHPFRPFSFTGYVNGTAIGIIGRDVEFDRQMDMKQDIDFSLMCLYRKRILFRDLRFAFEAFGYFTNGGGLAGRRTRETMERDITRLKEKWGKAVEVSHFDRRAKGGKHRNIMIHVER